MSDGQAGIKALFLHRFQLGAVVGPRSLAVLPARTRRAMVRFCKLPGQRMVAASAMKLAPKIVSGRVEKTIDRRDILPFRPKRMELQALRFPIPVFLHQPDFFGQPFRSPSPPANPRKNR